MVLISLIHISPFLLPAINCISNNKESRDIFVLPSEKTIRFHMFEVSNLDSECALELTENAA